jgi:hypothetical protein
MGDNDQPRDHFVTGQQTIGQPDATITSRNLNARRNQQPCGKYRQIAEWR